MGVKVAKWGNSLGVRIPKDVVEALELKEGDSVQVGIKDSRTLVLSRQSREDLIARMQALAKPLPPGWKFDREEANRR